jgi:hypothetical protein
VQRCRSSIQAKASSTGIAKVCGRTFQLLATSGMLAHTSAAASGRCRQRLAVQRRSSAVEPTSAAALTRITSVTPPAASAAYRSTPPSQAW